MWSTKNRKHISQILKAFKENDVENLRAYLEFLNIRPQNLPKEARVFTESELEEMKKEFPRGLTAQKIVELFQGKGIRFSMPTFRKYVQRGFLETGTRTGKQEALYPLSSIRRIEFIKYLVKQKVDLSDIKIEETQLPDLWEFYVDSDKERYVEELMEEFFEEDERERRQALLEKAKDLICESERKYHEAIAGLPEEKISLSQMDEFLEIFSSHPGFIAMRESGSEQEEKGEAN